LALSEYKIARSIVFKETISPNHCSRFILKNHNPFKK
jgi:hypothetical protein